MSKGHDYEVSQTSLFSQSDNSSTKMQILWSKAEKYWQGKSDARPSATRPTTKLVLNGLESSPALHGERPESNHISHGKDFQEIL